VSGGDSSQPAHIVITFGILGVSTLGLLFVIYFYQQLAANKSEEVARERLANVEDFNGVDFGAY
jgi:hypothetical protein